MTFAAYAYIARLLGPAGFGYIEWAGTVLLCMSLLVDQGFSSFGAREIARSPSETQRLVIEVLTARFLLATVGFILITLFAVVFVTEPSVQALLIVFGLSLWFLPLMLQWVFQGHDQMHLVAIAQILRQLIFVIAVFAFVQSGSDLVWVGAAEVLAVATTAVFTVVIFRARFNGQILVRPRISIRSFREAAPIGISQLLWVSKMFGAVFVLGLVANPIDVGYFAGAMRIYVALHTFVWLYYYNLLPSMSRAWQSGPEHLAALINRSMKIVAIAATLGGLVGVLAAAMMMTTAYGAGFLPGATALQWMAGACALAAVNGHYRFGLIAAGRQGKEMLAMALGSITAITLLPFAYINWGLGGAGAVLFFAEFLILVSSVSFAKYSLLSAEHNDRADTTRLKTLVGTSR
jgi:PST family polysaccharide transporter